MTKVEMWGQEGERRLSEKTQNKLGQGEEGWRWEAKKENFINYVNNSVCLKAEYNFNYFVCFALIIQSLEA